MCASGGTGRRLPFWGGAGLMATEGTAWPGTPTAHFQDTPRQPVWTRQRILFRLAHSFSFILALTIPLVLFLVPSSFSAFPCRVNKYSLIPELVLASLLLLYSPHAQLKNMPSISTGWQEVVSVKDIDLGEADFRLFFTGFSVENNSFKQRFDWKHYLSGKDNSPIWKNSK